MPIECVRLTFVWPGSPPQRADLLLRGPAGTTWAQVRPLVASALAADGLSITGQLATALREVDEAVPLGRPPLIDGAVLGTGAPEEEIVPDLGLLVAEVRHGPDAGRTIALTAGRHSLGRCLAPGAPGASTLALRDPNVSRAQAEIVVGPLGLSLVESGSINGTRVDGQPVRSQVGLSLGSRIDAGASQLVIAVAGDDRPWPVEFVEPEPLLLRLPAAPEPPPSPVFPWLALGLGLGVSLLLATVLHSALFLLLGLASPVLALGQVLTDVRARRSKLTRDQQVHRAASAAVLERAQQALHHEQLARQQIGDAINVLAAARRPRWAPIPPGRAIVTLGRGTVRSGVSLDQGAGPTVLDLPEAPLTVDLLRGCSTIAGPRAQRLGVARFVVGQLVARLPPDHLQLMVATDQADDWEWTTWLPHARPGGDLQPECHAMVATGPGRVATLMAALRRCTAERSTRSAAEADAEPPTQVLLCWDLPGPPPDVADESLGLHVVRLAASCEAADHPDQALGTVMEVDSTARLRVRTPTSQHAGHADLVAPWWSQRLARALAARPAPSARPTTSEHPAARRGRALLPVEVRLSELLDDGLDAGSLRRAWAAPARPRVPVGVTEFGTAWLDLGGTGPHLLVAGTTGAGKSQLLRTLVAGLAIRNRPDNLALLLVDYKGGAAFGACTRLPHTTGLVTDLDQELTTRALLSLRAEITRRERLLAEHGAADFAEYAQVQTHWQGAAGPEPPRLARLVVVVDEFRALAEDLPDFVTGLVRLAAVGRSLGVHLVLATQRPAGVVSADIRANVTTRIALRVADQVESRDVVECPDAARLPASLPGRAVMRVGSEPPQVMQCARVDLPAGTPLPDVRLVPARQVGDPVPALPRSSADRLAVRPLSELDQLVLTARTVCTADGIAAAPAVWWPPLPEVLPADALPPGQAMSGLALGLLDDPAGQWQGPIAWLPERDGALAVIGSPGSGRTTTLRRLVRAAAQVGPVWVVDGAGTLRAEADRPGVIGVANLADLEHAGRLLASAAQHRPGLLVVHAWEAVMRHWQLEAPALYDDLLTVASGGHVQLVVSGGRGVLSGALGAMCTSRLVMRLADRADCGLLGLSRAELPSRWPAGRGLLTRPGVEGVRQVQVALPGSTAAADPNTLPTAGRRVVPLPYRVCSAECPAASTTAAEVLLGRADQGWAAWDTARFSTLLIAGRAGSGRSSALSHLARSAAAHSWSVCTGTEPFTLHASDTLLVLVDSDDSQEHSDRALTLLESAPRGVRVLVAVASELPEPAAFGVVAHPLLARVAAAGHGIVLNPVSGRDGELLGVRVPVLGAPRPGRGVLTAGTALTPVQLLSYDGDSIESKIRIEPCGAQRAGRKTGNVDT